MICAFTAQGRAATYPTSGLRRNSDHRYGDAEVANHYEDVALRGFSAEEAAALKAMLERVYRNVAALEDQTAPEGETKAA